MGKFDYDDKFNVNNEFVNVKFGYDTPILETDLNEMQSIIKNNINNKLRILGKSGILELKDKDFTGDNFVFNPPDINKQEDNYMMERNLFLIAPMKVNINGYVVHVRGDFTLLTDDNSIIDEYVPIYLNEPSDNASPTTRNDLVYLEVWFTEVNSNDKINKYGQLYGQQLPNTLIDDRVGIETTHRIVLNWKISVAENIDFDTWEYGFGYNNYDTQNYSKIQTDVQNIINTDYMMNNEFIYHNKKVKDMTTAEYENMVNDLHNKDRIFKRADNNIFASCSFFGDTNLWIAGDPVDNTFIKDENFVYAIPLFKVSRRNKQQYSVNNIGGSIDYNNYNKNIRPDCKCYDLIYKSDILDLRKNIMINNYDINNLRDNTLNDIMTGVLTTKTNEKLKRVQFGVKSIDLTTKNLIFSDTFNESNITRTGQTRNEIKTNINNTTTLVPFVSKNGLLINNQIQYEYIINMINNNIDSNYSINANKGVIEFFFQPLWNSFDDGNEMIFQLNDKNTNDPFITMEKQDDTLIFTRYSSNNKPEIIILHAEQYPLIFNRIYHFRISWNVLSSDVNNIDNRFIVYINGKKIVETIAYVLTSNFDPNRLLIGDANNNNQFIIDELNIYNDYIQTWYLPNDFVNSDSLILPSFNGYYRNFRDNDIIQEKTIQYIKPNNNNFSINAPYNTYFINNIKVYLMSNYNNLNIGEEISFNSNLTNNNTQLNLTLNDSRITNINNILFAVQYDLILKGNNYIDDIPDTMLYSEIQDYNNNKTQVVFFNKENLTNELSQPNQLNILTDTNILNYNPNYHGRKTLYDLQDNAYDYSTYRDESLIDFAFGEILDYYMTGNGTNQIVIPINVYNRNILYIRSASLINNDEQYIEITNIQIENNANFRITLKDVYFVGDKIKLELAIGGISFDYDGISKTFIGNTCISEYIQFISDGENFEYIIPLNSNTQGIQKRGILKSYANIPKFVNNKLTIDTNNNICFYSNDNKNFNMTTFEYIDGYNKPFLHIKMTSKDENGNIIKLPKNTIIKIPVFETYHMDDNEIVSIWYNYTPYQGTLSNNNTHIKRISDWKYFITTLSSGGNITNTNNNSLNNLINRLPGGSSNSYYIKGEDIITNNMMNNNNVVNEYNKKLIFTDIKNDGYINNLDDNFIELKTDFNLYKYYGELQDNKLTFNINFYKYLNTTINPINKYCGLYCVVENDYGDLLLLIISDININPSILSTITPKYGDLFIIKNRPNLIIRNK